MKTKTKHSRIKITLLDENGQEVTHEEEIAISEYKSYDDMEDRIIEIEKNWSFFKSRSLKKKDQEQVEKVLEENPKFVQNGNKSIKIKDKSGIWNYMRQQLISRKKNTKKVRKVPIDEFLGIRKRGLSHVSRSLEKDTLQTVTENRPTMVCQNLFRLFFIPVP